MEKIAQMLLDHKTDATQAHIWHDALAAIADNTMHVDAASLGGVTLLHLACYYGKVDVVRQLLFVFHANPSLETSSDHKWRPMHHAAMSGSANALAICKLLPVADLISRNACGKTPLFEALSRKWFKMIPDVFQWMIQEPQCDLFRVMHCLRDLRYPKIYICMLDAEIAARKRWTAARAAWCAAACDCA